MPRVRKRASLRRRDWGDDHFVQLAVGFDYFGAWGDPHRLPIDQRDYWPAPEILEDMAACWAEHGEAIIAEFGERHGRPLWGEAVFDLGWNPRDALSSGRRRQAETLPDY